MPTIPRHLPGPAIGVIKRDVERAELQPEQPVGAGKGRLDHAVQLQVGFQRRLVQVMLGLAPPRRVIVPVPGLQRPVDPVFLHHRRQHLGIGLGPRAGGRPDLHQQVAHPVGAAGHLGLQLVGGKTVITQERGALLAQRQDLGRDGAVVGLAAIGPARHPGAIGPFAQIATQRELQEGHDQRARQGHDRACGLFLLPRRAGGGGDETGQPLQILLGQVHEPVALVRQQVLGEFGTQHRQPRLDVLHPRLGLPAERGTRTNKATMGQHQYPLLFVGQFQILARLPHGGDAGEQRLVGRNLGEMRRQLGRERALQLFSRRIAVRPRHGKEHAQNPVQCTARRLERLDNIGKGRRLGAVGDGSDLGPVFGKRRLQRRGEIAVRDPVERGDVERGLPIGKDGVGHAALLCPTS